MVPSYFTTALVTVPSKRPSELLKENTFYVKAPLTARSALFIVVKTFQAELHDSFKGTMVAFIE